MEFVQFTLNQYMMYTFSIHGDVPKINEAASTVPAKSVFIIILRDSDMHMWSTLGVSLDMMTDVVDNDGNRIGLTVQGKSHMYPDDYRAISDWNIGWDF